MTALLLTVLYTIVTSPELVKRMTRMINIESPQAMGVWFLGILNSEMGVLAYIHDGLVHDGF